MNDQTATLTEAQEEWALYLVGAIKADDLTHEENRTKIAAKQAADREHDLVMLGYNQAMLEWASLPFRNAEGDAALTREQIEQTIINLRTKLGM